MSDTRSFGPALGRRRAILLAALAPSLGRAAPAWPTRPITVVVPFAPGGAGNGSMRIVAEVLSPQLGQPLVIDNRPGAGGVTGTAAVAQSRDDHLLLMGSTSMTILPALRQDLRYDVQRDLQPVGLLSRQPLVLAVGADAPFASLAALVDKARAGDTVSAGNSGVGTLSHLTTELLNQQLGTRLQSVPYRGDAALLPDVSGGIVSMGVFNLPVALPLITSGRLRAIAVTSREPVATLPGVPTLRSAGGDAFVIDGWAALFAARQVPRTGVERLDDLLRQALADADVRQRFERFGVSAAPADSAALKAFVRAETERWGSLIRSRGIKLD